MVVNRGEPEFGEWKIPEAVQSFLYAYFLALNVLEEKKDVLLISQGAHVNERGTRYALVYDPETGTSERQKIQVGISDGSQVEVASGLDAEQQIVIP